MISQKEMSTFFLLPLLIVFPLPLFSFFHIPISLLRPSSLTLFLPFFYVLLPLPIFELQVLHISTVYNQHFVIRHVNKSVQNFYLDIQLKHKRTFPNCFFLGLPFSAFLPSFSGIPPSVFSLSPPLASPLSRRPPPAPPAAVFLPAPAVSVTCGCC